MSVISKTTESVMLEYANEDVGNIVLLEHVNLQVPDQALATLFDVVGLGLTRDPFLNIGVIPIADVRRRDDEMAR